ncbi:MAG: hypothetical protein D8H92_08545, partial [Campylobacter sp.]
NLCKICDAAKNGKHGNSKLAALKDGSARLPRPPTHSSRIYLLPLAAAKQTRLVSKAINKINRSNPSAK